MALCLRNYLNVSYVIPDIQDSSYRLVVKITNGLGKVTQI